MPDTSHIETGPNQRPDSAPIHDNPIRAFREELRLSRGRFGKLVGASPDTLRGWEAGISTPRGPAAIRLVDTAKRNLYPLTLEVVLQCGMMSKKKRRKRNGN